VLTAVACLFAVGLTTNLSLSTTLAVVNSGNVIWVVGLLGLPAVGALVAARQPANRVGHVLLGIGLAFGLALALTGIGRQTADADPAASAKLALLLVGCGSSDSSKFPCWFCCSRPVGCPARDGERY
jgi:hypothetical protein